MNWMTILGTIGASLIVGCSATGDLQSDYYHPLRAGTLSLRVVPGLYRVEAKTAPAFLNSVSELQALWDKTARGVCGNARTKELLITESSYPVISESADRVSEAILVQQYGVGGGLAAKSLRPKQIVWVRKGYVLCEDSGMLPTDAVEAITRMGWPTK